MGALNLTWSTPDGRFKVSASEVVVRRMLKRCSHAGLLETGGILIGQYDVAGINAHIRSTDEAPQDSHSGLTWFARGVSNLQSKLDHLWREGQGYYLGEWHFHPFSAPTPSQQDHLQMAFIAHDVAYACPEPLLVIVGGDPISHWLAQVWVYPGGQPQKLEALSKYLEIGGF